MNRLGQRLTRLEQGRATAEPQLRYFTLWDDEPLPEDYHERDLVIRLARKAETVEAWVEQCRELGFTHGDLNKEGR
jgi:hypothetical protein